MNTPLKTYREDRRLTSREVAVALGINPSHYRRVEIGETVPSPHVANQIAKYFGNAVTRDQILFPEDYLTPEKKSSGSAAQLRRAS
jgi:transcriptional regulator with XRE-family HTH domain